jgi:hypothetical protein
MLASEYYTNQCCCFAHSLFIVGDILRQHISRTGQLHLGSIPCSTSSFWRGALFANCGSDCLDRYGYSVPESDDGTLGADSEYSLAIGTLYRCCSVPSCCATAGGTASGRICCCVGKGALHVAQIICAGIYRFRCRLSKGEMCKESRSMVVPDLFGLTPSLTLHFDIRLPSSFSTFATNWVTARLRPVV